MIILEDTRNPVSKHKNIHDYCNANNIEIVRTKLVVGDYTLPINQSISIDTKADLQEVYGNIVQQHERFKAECVLAQNLGIKLIVLVEESGICNIVDVDGWKNPRAEQYAFIQSAHAHGKMLDRKLPSTPPISSQRLRVCMQTMAERYGISWMFCNKMETGRLIIELLGGDC